MDVRVIRDDEWDVFLTVFGTALGHRPPDEILTAWRATLDDDRTFGALTDGDHMVGTAADFATELTLPGGATVPAVAVTAVGTLPTHRRQGVADALMRHQLRTARDRGAAAAVLHASEATIYPRWGYGASMQMVSRRLPTAHAGLRDRPDASGHVAYLLGDDRRAVMSAIHEASRRDTPGEIARTEALWDLRLVDGEGPPKTFVAHVDASGQPDAYVGYRLKGGWDEAVPAGKVEVFDTAAVSAGAHLALWSWLLSLDLVAEVETAVLPDDDPLLFALRDPRRFGTSWRTDGLWVRPLDVARLLRDRRWMTDGELVLDVADDLFEDQSGGYRVVQDGDDVAVERTDDAPDVRLAVSELGSLVLGGVPPIGLALAGRLEAASMTSLRRLTAMLPADRLAYCRTHF